MQTYFLRRPRERRVRVATGEVIQVASGCDGHLGRKDKADVAAEEEDLYTELKVPSVAPTISNCSLLKVEYAVEVHVSGKGQVGKTETVD